MDEFIRKAKIINIVDGDTLDAIVDLGFGIKTTQRFRLLGVDTPERSEEGYLEAKNYTLNNLIEQEVYIKSKKTDSFGRFLGTIFLEDGTNFNQTLIDNGLATEY